MLPFREEGNDALLTGRHCFGRAGPVHVLGAQVQTVLEATVVQDFQQGTVRVVSIVQFILITPDCRQTHQRSGVAKTPVRFPACLELPRAVPYRAPMRCQRNTRTDPENERLVQVLSEAAFLVSTPRVASRYG